MKKFYINPTGNLEYLTKLEIEILKNNTHNSKIYQLYRNCSLAILNSGVVTDNAVKLMDLHESFHINILNNERGIYLELINPPESAFVDGFIIKNIQQNLLAVIRDILFMETVANQLPKLQSLVLSDSDYVTNLIFYILRNAGFFHNPYEVDLVVCWGGHSIKADEYAYCRELGVELGLRKLNIVTGCGAGVMEAPMKGAAVGHANQRYSNNKFIGITEPSIISSEPPNPIVNELLIMPDIEKRLETFARLGHAIIIFPGGPGTFEELLYIIGILSHPNNKNNPLPVILTGNTRCAEYFDTINSFIKDILGDEITKLYEIIIDKPKLVAQEISRSMRSIKDHRRKTGDSYAFNWSLYIDHTLQERFVPTHENMEKLELNMNMPQEKLIVNLRNLFSGIVAGNIKPDYIKQVKQKGPYKIHGEPFILKRIEKVLLDFIEQGRMKLPGETYNPCFTIVK